MAADEGRAAALKGVVGSELHAVVHSARVLVVGAGGIGCELLKNLAMCGFGEVELVSWQLCVCVVWARASE
jgi:ubiquitin-like 1-activating enzyme E1 B